jgi:hypothetical protein
MWKVPNLASVLDEDKDWQIARDVWHGALSWCSTNPFITFLAVFTACHFIGILTDLCSIQGSHWCLKAGTQLKRFLRYQRDLLTWLSHSILIDVLFLLVVSSVFYDENSAVCFSIISIFPRRYQCSNFIKTWIWIHMITQFHWYQQAESFLFIWQKAWTKFCTHSSHVQIFHQCDLHRAKWYVQSIRYFLNY